jgi:subtilisin family serine protease
MFVVGIFFFFAAAEPGFAARWILNSSSESLPDDLEAKIQQAGGTLIQTMDNIGIAVAEFPTRESAESMETFGLDAMIDVELNWFPGERYVLKDEGGLDAPLSQDQHVIHAYQWYLPLMKADMAWDLGVMGAGVRVAVVDTGIWYPHPGLYSNIDFAASTTFVEGTTSFMDDNGHGTHVAGIIASNGYRTRYGMAPQATLIGIKALKSNGSGYISWIVAGIVHAVNHDADIVNLSLGGALYKNGYDPYYTARDAAEVIKMYRKTINWASSNDVLVVCSAGNSALDMDHDENFMTIPAQAGNCIVVSATGPIGLANFDHFAGYSNYGSSTIWVAAPGGNFTLYPAPSWHLDMIYSTYINDGYAWTAGTSMSAPMVSGEAALILSKYGPMSVGQLKNLIAQTADDVGKPGKDPYYGRGRINAYNAVTK